TDPTADRVVTFKNEGGTVAYVADIPSVSGFLVAANNLSDLTNAATARTNLGLGDIAALDDVALATDTTGNYVATLADAGGSDFTITNSGTENAAVTIDLANNAVDFDEMANAMSLDAATSITGTAGEVLTLTRTTAAATTENGMSINLTTGAGGGNNVYSALNISVTSADHSAVTDKIYGLNIANLTDADADGDEVALFIGASWDNAISTGGGEFLVNGNTGSITINDGSNAGQVSIEGTILDINSMDFVGAGVITTTGGLTLGDAGNTTAITSSDWAVDATGAITGVAFNANDAGNSLTNVDNADLTDDTIDFDKMSDTLALDAATLISLGTNTFTINLNNTGDFQIQDGGDNILHFNDADGIMTFSDDVDMALTGTENLYITNTTGDAAVNLLDLTLTNTDSTAATQYGLKITNANNAAVSTTESLIYLSNVDGDTVENGIVLSGGAGINTGISMTGTNNGLSIDTDGSASAAYTGKMIDLDFDQIYTADADADNTGNGIIIDRNIVMNNAGNTLTVSGDVFSITNFETLTDGTITDTSSLIYLNQTFSSAAGAVVDIINNGSGAGISILQTGNASAISIDANNGSASYAPLDISTKNPGGNIQKIYYGSATSQTSALTGIDLDLTSLTNNNTNNIYGLHINDFTLGAGTTGNQYGAYIEGTNWDYGLYVQDETYLGAATDIETSLTIDAPAYVASGYTQRLCSSSGGGNGIALDEVMIVDCLDAGQADYAEMYPVASDITYGDIVVPGSTRITAENGDVISQMVKSTSAYQNIFGSVVVDNYEDGTSSGYNIAESDNPMPVSLVGRVPVHVTNEGGAISVGDPITTSSTAGYGMKATEPGMIIGYALNNFSEASGEVVVFVHSGWYAGNVIGTDGSATIVSDALVLNSLETASAETPSVASQIFSLRGSAWNGTSAQALDMKIQTSVTDTDSYRLSIKNTVDTEVAYVTNEGTLSLAGDLIVTGKIYPSDRGATQTSKYIFYDGSAGPGGDMMRTNAAGWSTGSYDFAEMFPAEETLEAGDVVVFSGINENVGKTNTTYHQKIAGVISTRPGFLAGDNLANHFPVALAGRVPTKVNLEGGTIEVGDPLTTSSTSGYAMKATENGVIVGYALEPYSTVSADQKITVFIKAGYYQETGVSTVPGISNDASLLSTNTNSISNLTSLNLESSLYLGGNDILNIRRLVGLGEKWSIEEDGTFKTEGLMKTVINSYQNEKVETTAVTSTGVFVTLVGTATLQNGEAIVAFEDIDPAFNDIISNTAPIRVVVTPSGPVSLYIPEKNSNGFLIKQISGSDSEIPVDWMVTAYRKDFEPVVAVEIEAAGEAADATEASEATIEEAIETQPITESEIAEIAEPASSESLTQPNDPTIESDGGLEPEPLSTDSASTSEVSTQTGG
ncbi:MAG: hypothetical protein V1664_04890, partial [Candidatus Uhrbacteria bacterium]